MSKAPPEAPDATAGDAAFRRRSPFWKRWSQRAAIAVITLIILTELALRFILGLGHPLLYVRDDAAGYLPAPNQHLWRFFATNDINAQSMRSPPLQQQKVPGALRILFVGDSVTYGQTYTDQKCIFTSILNRDLPGVLHRPVEVLNASAGGWAVGNELGYLRSHGTYAADLVIFVLNTPDMIQPFNDTRPGETPAMPTVNPPCAIAEAWTHYLHPYLSNTVFVDRGTWLAADAEQVQPMDKTLAQLQQANALVHQAGGTFAIVFSPAVEGNGRVKRELRQGDEVLHNWTDQAHVPLLDLESAYAGAGPQVWRDGIHLTLVGNEIAARAMEDWPWLREWKLNHQ